MALPKDIVNKRFGRLIVIKRNPVNGNRRQVRWDCICDCGNEHTVTSESLNNGKSKSCGCLLRDARYAKNKNFDREKAMLLLVYSPLKKRHNLRFSNTQYISFDEFKKLSLSDCHYCGSKPTNSQYDVRYGKDKVVVTDFVLKYNGIDRKDSSVGYTKDNVVPCCKFCNTAKNTLSQSQFAELIKRIYNHWASV